MRSISKAISWKEFEEADKFTRAALLGTIGLAASLVTIVPLGLLVDRSLLDFWARYAAFLYFVIFGSAISRILYYWTQGVALAEQVGYQENVDDSAADKDIGCVSRM